MSFLEWLGLVRIDVVTELESALAMKLRDEVRLQSDLNVVEDDLRRERDRRVMAEALASERREEVERLVVDLKESRDLAGKVMSERLKSLDTLNTRLLEGRSEGAPPNWDEIHAKNEQLREMGRRAVSNVQQIHRNMDAAILAKMHPAFAKRNKPPVTPEGGVLMNSPMAPAPNGEGA